MNRIIFQNGWVEPIMFYRKHEHDNGTTSFELWGEDNNYVYTYGYIEDEYGAFKLEEIFRVNFLGFDYENTPLYERHLRVWNVLEIVIEGVSVYLDESRLYV